MKTEENKLEKPVLEKIAARLMEAQQELDELAVQLALGKAEAKDKFDEVKHEFNERLTHMRTILEAQKLQPRYEALKVRFQELQVQLALGKAETKEKFEEQKEKILHALKLAEAELKKNISALGDLEIFAFDAEKFKLQLEVLRLKYELKKFEVRDSFSNQMLAARKSISAIGKKFGGGKSKYNEFKDDVTDAYKQIRKAVKAL